MFDPVQDPSSHSSPDAEVTQASGRTADGRATQFLVPGAGEVSEGEVVLPKFDLFRADAVDWLRTLQSDSVDLVVTDPAYESLEKHRKVGTTTRLKHSAASSNDWFAIFPNSRFPELLAEVYRVLKKHRHFYLFCDQETMFVVKPLAEAAGFKFWKPIVWDKQKIGMGYHYRARYEFILFFEKGKRKINDLGVPDVLSFSRIHRGYPAEKPVELSQVLIRQSSQPGEVVIDPFMGSGSAGVAAVSQQRHFLGTDVCAEAREISLRRLLEAGAQPGADLELSVSDPLLTGRPSSSNP